MARTRRIAHPCRARVAGGAGSSAPPFVFKTMNDRFEDSDATREARERMVARQIERRDVTDERVLHAMRAVRRHAFVPDELREFAYEDRPLPIAREQTISQPFIVAYMSELLELSSTDRVLEIGTGSGYAAAVLAEIVAEVFTIERHDKLADSATAVFSSLGYSNIRVKLGDGTLGWPEEAPFDAIVATAAGPRVPEALKRQLAVGGRLVVPVGDRLSQELVRVRRTGEDRWETEQVGGVRFVPLIGAEGWND